MTEKKTPVDPSDVRIDFTCGHYPAVPDEPMDFCRFVGGTISLYDEADAGVMEDPREIGSISLFDVRLDLAHEYQCSSFDVLDSVSQDTAAFLPLLEEDGWTDLVRKRCEPYSDDLVIIDRVKIEEPYRGRGIGLLAVRHALEIYGHHLGVAALIPFPLQFGGSNDPEFELPPGVTDKEQARDSALAKLRAHWSRLGFRQFDNTEINIRGMSRRLPDPKILLKPPPPTPISAARTVGRCVPRRHRRNG